MPDKYMTIGGVTIPEHAAREALMLLREAPGVMIRQPLSRAASPLAAMDYHAVARSEREIFPELVLRPGTHHSPTPHEKTAVIHHLDRVLDG